ncbi:MAG TPA: hypothetical protein VF322_07625 [Gammaproteobacteria bacterium]
MRTPPCLLPVACVAAVLAGCAMNPPPPSPPAPPFMPVADVRELMESVVAHAAEVYWESVSVVVSQEGVQENYPETDEEWEEVWAAAMTLAESGNLLMMEPRAVDRGPWMGFSAALVNAGVAAAGAALAKDPDRVFEAGEQVYDVCVACHEQYISDESLLQ